MKGRDNAVKRFQKTWTSANSVKINDSIGKVGVVKDKPHPPSDDEDSDEITEDKLEDFELSSVESD